MQDAAADQAACVRGGIPREHARGVQRIHERDPPQEQKRMGHCHFRPGGMSGACGAWMGHCHFRPGAAGARMSGVAVAYAYAYVYVYVHLDPQKQKRMGHCHFRPGAAGGGMSGVAVAYAYVYVYVYVYIHLDMFG